MGHRIAAVSLPNLLCMARKAVAAVLLLVITAWAEMALAPMLAILAGHMHGEHALAAKELPQHTAHHVVSTRQGAKHACCPSIGRVEAEGVLELVAENSGCRDSHRCCFRQGPQSVPAPISEARQLGSQLSSTAPSQVPQIAASSYRIEAETEFASPPYPHLFGMTLQI